MNIYEELGVQPIINASGSVTRLGGAPMPDEVLEAFRSASEDAVSLEELQAAACKKIAAATGMEAGLVTAGCAAALTMGAAAILAKLDLSRMEKLPHTESFPNEFVIAREQRSGYDHAVRASGARLVEVGFNEIVANAGVRRTEAWEYEAAFDEKTAGVVYVFGPSSQPHLSEVVERARRFGLPVLVDAAAEVPPRENFKILAASGADLVTFSGGKYIRGPQSTGILCGRRDLVSSAALQMLDMDDHPQLWSPPPEFIDRKKLDGVPRHGIGRGMKVSKEEIVALLKALDLFTSGAYDRDVKLFVNSLETIRGELYEPGNHVAVDDPEIVGPSHGGQSAPTLEIPIDERLLGRTAFDVCESLRRGSPPIYVSHGKLREGRLVIRPNCLKPGHARIIADRLVEELAIPR